MNDLLTSNHQRLGVNDLLEVVPNVCTAPLRLGVHLGKVSKFSSLLLLPMLASSSGVSLVDYKSGYYFKCPSHTCMTRVMRKISCITSGILCSQRGLPSSLEVVRPQANAASRSTTYLPSVRFLTSDLLRAHERI